MGLDIIACKKLRKVFNPERDDEGYLVDESLIDIDEGVMNWLNDVFPGRTDGLTVGYYDYQEKTEFHAGSYSGYNWWREKLRQFKGDVAFQELIEFSDCDGYIGPVTSKKLAKDFADYEKEAKKSVVNNDDEYWFEMYQEWKTAFELAADDGVVCFR